MLEPVRLSGATPNATVVPARAVLDRAASRAAPFRSAAHRGLQYRGVAAPATPGAGWP